MRIYERYFARQIYLAFIFILFAFSGLFFFFDLINELNTVGHGNYNFTLAVLRVALQTPSRFYEIIPVADTVLVRADPTPAAPTTRRPRRTRPLPGIRAARCGYAVRRRQRAPDASLTSGPG